MGKTAPRWCASSNRSDATLERVATLLYDVTQSGYTGQAFGIGAAVLGIAFVACAVLRGRLGRMPVRGTPWTISNGTFGMLWCGLAGSITGSMYAEAHAAHEAQLDAVRSGQCRVVEGPVVDLKVDGYENHKNVSFRVGDATFDYQENRLDGFHELPRDGVPFGGGTPVRITACAGRGRHHDVARFEVL